MRSQHLAKLFSLANSKLANSVIGAVVKDAAEGGATINDTSTALLKAVNALSETELFACGVEAAEEAAEDAADKRDRAKPVRVARVPSARAPGIQLG